MVILAAVMSVLFALSEALSLIPAVKANGVFQAIVAVIKFIMEKILKK